eukprot:3753904-Prorocentrum_lima.AAC.1
MQNADWVVSSCALKVLWQPRQISHPFLLPFFLLACLDFMPGDADAFCSLASVEGCNPWHARPASLAAPS